jgi:polysaccharide biosynthesis protein PslE
MHSEGWALYAPHDILAAARRHWLSIAVCSFAFALLAAIGLKLAPTYFQSDGLMFVRLGRGAVTLDPTSTASGVVSLQETREAQIISVRELVGSRTLSERVVDRIGEERLLQPVDWVDRTMNAIGALRSSGGMPTEGGFTAQEIASLERREAAIERVRQSIDIAWPKHSYTIRIEARCKSPILARDLVQAMMEEYQTFHVEAHRSNGSLEFFIRQADASLTEAMEKQEKLRMARNRMSVMDIDQKRATLQGKIAALENDRVTSISALAGAEAQTDALTEEVGEVPDRVAMDTTTGIANAASDGMRQQLYALEQQEAALRGRYKDDHPKVKQVREQLASSRAILGRTEAERPQQRQSVNPVEQQLEVALRTSKASETSISAKLEAIDKSLAEARVEMEQLNQQSVELSELTWAAKIAEDTYLRQARSREEAKTIKALDEQNISDISIAQPAALILEKASPKRGVLFVVASMMGLCVAIAQAIVRDLLVRGNRSQRPTTNERTVSVATAQAQPIAVAPSEATVANRG